MGQGIVRSVWNFFCRLSGPQVVPASSFKWFGCRENFDFFFGQLPRCRNFFVSNRLEIRFGCWAGSKKTLCKISNQLGKWFWSKVKKKYFWATRKIFKFLNFFFLIKIRFGRLVMRLLKNGGDAGFQLILLTGIGQEVIKFFFLWKKGCLIFFQENLKTG